MDLARLFEPEQVAVFLDPGRADDPGRIVAEHLVAGDFAGQLVPIAPGGGTVQGLACLADPRDHPHPIDLALVGGGPAGWKQAVDRAILAGAGAVALLAEPPAEPEAADWLADIGQRCAARSVALIGPGSPGLINPHRRMNASAVAEMPPAGGVALLAESRALALAMLDRPAALGLGLSVAVGLGDKAGLDEVELFRYLAQDERTRLVIAYLERIDDGKEFLKRAEALASVKPVVVLKAGSTRAGERAAARHTGQPVAGDIAFGAAFRRAGVIRAESFQALFDIAQALIHQPLPAGRRTAVITNAGGPGILAADALEQAGLELAELSPATAAGLGVLAIDDPLDLGSAADAGRLAEAARAVAGDEGTDALLLLVTPGLACASQAAAERLPAAVAQGRKPALAVALGGRRAEELSRLMLAAGLPCYPSPVRAAVALAALERYAAWQRRPLRVVTRFRVNRRRVERILLRHERMGLRQIQEHLARELLEAYDFHVPRGRLVTEVDEAVEAASRLGFPVRMQVVSIDVLDPAGLGGRRTGLASAAAVRDAYDLIHLGISRHQPRARIDGVFIEKAPPAGQEVVIGMTRDPQFGPMLMFGLGGVSVEVMQDVAFHLAPITADEARQMLGATRAFRLLEQRSRQAGGLDLEAIVAALQRISQLATDFPRIQELEVNPLVLSQPGTEPLVAGTRILLGEGRPA